MSKSPLQDAIDSKIEETIASLEEKLEIKIENEVKEYLERNLVEFVNRAVLQMLATPYSPGSKNRKIKSRRVEGHHHPGMCGPNCFEGRRDADGNMIVEEE